VTFFLAAEFDFQRKAYHSAPAGERASSDVAGTQQSHEPGEKNTMAKSKDHNIEVRSLSDLS